MAPDCSETLQTIYLSRLSARMHVLEDEQRSSFRAIERRRRIDRRRLRTPTPAIEQGCQAPGQVHIELCPRKVTKDTSSHSKMDPRVAFSKNSTRIQSSVCTVAVSSSQSLSSQRSPSPFISLFDHGRRQENLFCGS